MTGYEACSLWAQWFTAGGTIAATVTAIWLSWSKGRPKILFESSFSVDIDDNKEFIMQFYNRSGVSEFLYYPRIGIFRVLEYFYDISDPADYHLFFELKPYSVCHHKIMLNQEDYIFTKFSRFFFDFELSLVFFKIKLPQFIRNKKIYAKLVSKLLCVVIRTRSGAKLSFKCCKNVQNHFVKEYMKYVEGQPPKADPQSDK